MTDEYTMYDAAYLLGALSPQERADYEAHLAGCADCQRAVSASAGLPGLLASVSPEDLERASADLPDVPATLLPNLLAEVERSRFRRRTVTVLIAAAAACVLILGIVVGVTGVGRGGSSDQVAPPAGGFQQLTALRTGLPITASAKLEPTAWGTKVTLRCVYDTPASGGLHYQNGTAPWFTMIVTDKSGQVQQIAGWEAKPGAPLVVNGMTSMPRSSIASVEIRDDTKAPVLELSL